MPLSSIEQRTIRDMVAAASPGQRDNMRLDAEAALTKINNLMTQRLLSQEESANLRECRLPKTLVRREANSLIRAVLEIERANWSNLS
jgi:hypothetical protein